MGLEDVLEIINQQEEEVVNQPFTVTDLDSAAEAQRRITYFNDRIKEIESTMNKQLEPFLKKIELIKEWAQSEKEVQEDKIKHYSNMLELFIREEVMLAEVNGKKPKKIIKLPYGKIQLKKQQPEFERDEEMLFSFAKDHGYTKIKESTDWSTLKKQCQVVNGRLVTEDGEAVPGVVVTERDDEFNLVLED